MFAPFAGCVKLPATTEMENPLDLLDDVEYQAH